MTLTLHSFAVGRRLLAVAALAAVVALASALPAQAVVILGEASGYGVSANVILGAAPQFVIVDHPATSGIAPAPFANNANLAASNFTSDFNGFTIAESDTGELDINASSNVDGGLGIRSASADATVDAVSIQNFTQIVPPLVPVTFDAVLDLQATEIGSTADVSGDHGALTSIGTASLSGIAGPGNDQASITVLGVEFLLDKNPAPGTSFNITPVQVPDLEGLITVIQNEQFEIGNGADDLELRVNALHIIIGTGMIKLPPNFQDAVWGGDIIVAHSQAKLTAERDPNIIPEPSTFALALMGLLILSFCGRRRLRR